MLSRKASSTVLKENTDMHIDHIGWITFDIQAFESFWCDVLGYECIHESSATEDMTSSLFGAESGAKIKRYHNYDLNSASPDIEIHYFPDCLDAPKDFHRFGINHVCLNTGKSGSRKLFLESLPSEVERRIYDNPKGWVEPAGHKSFDALITACIRSSPGSLFWMTRTNGPSGCHFAGSLDRNRAMVGVPSMAAKWVGPLS